MFVNLQSFLYGKSVEFEMFLIGGSTEKLVHTFITSSIDYCNSLLFGLCDFEIKKLQAIRIPAARLVTSDQKVWPYYHSVGKAALVASTKAFWI